MTHVQQQHIKNRKSFLHLSAEEKLRVVERERDEAYAELHSKVVTAESADRRRRQTAHDLVKVIERASKAERNNAGLSKKLSITLHKLVRARDLLLELAKDHPELCEKIQEIDAINKGSH